MQEQADEAVRGKACMEAAAVVCIRYILRHYHQHLPGLPLAPLVDTIPLRLGNQTRLCLL